MSLCNSDPLIVAMAARWMRRLSVKAPCVRVQYYADQGAEALRSVWAKTLSIEAERIRLHPKSNSGRLSGRVWRCSHGVATVEVHDTYFRARMCAWVDRLKASWD